MNERGKFVVAVLLMGGAVLAFLLIGCVPVPRSLPPGLASWAAEKAKRLAECYDAGHRHQDLLECLGTYATDRGTYACERAAALVTEQRPEG